MYKLVDYLFRSIYLEIFNWFKKLYKVFYVYVVGMLSKVSKLF